MDVRGGVTAWYRVPKQGAGGVSVSEQCEGGAVIVLFFLFFSHRGRAEKGWMDGLWHLGFARVALLHQHSSIVGDSIGSLYKPVFGEVWAWIYIFRCLVSSVWGVNSLTLLFDVFPGQARISVGSVLRLGINVIPDHGRCFG